MRFSRIFAIGKPLLYLTFVVATVTILFFSQGSHRHNVDVDGARREYILYSPRDTGELRPLLLAFHGFSGTAAGMQESARLHELVDEHGFFLVYLEGNPTWNRPRADVQTPDVAFFDKLCDELVARCPVDPERIYVAGMSMGGDFVIRLAGLRSDRIAAVVSQAMCTSEAVESPRPFPLMIIVGTEDDRVPPSYLEKVPDAFRENGHEVAVLQPKGVGHRWHRPLNRELWEFLSSHRLD